MAALVGTAGGLGACTATTPTAGPTAAPVSVAATCRRHYPTAVLSESSTVDWISHIGPAGTGSRPGPLDRYRADSAALLCLVPASRSMYDVIAILPGDRAVRLWSQNHRDQFTRPP